MITTTRKAFAAAVVVLALLAAALASPVIADDKDDLQRKKRGVSGEISGAKKAYDQSSKKFAGAVAALKKAQRQLDAAEEHLGSTRGQLATAEARDAQMQAELIKSEAELDEAIARLDQGKKDLKTSEVAVEQFTVESLQAGDRGLQAFGDLLRGESPTQFSEKMSLSDSVSDAQLATMQRLAASKVILQLNREKVQELRDQVAAARKAAAENLVRKQELEAAAEEQADEVDRLVGKRADARNSAAAIKRDDEEKLRELENERARLNARLAALAARDRKSGGRGSGGDGIGTLMRPVGGAITSSYGMRRHPITGVYKLHDGTDFSAGCGTPIRAAAAGTIIEQYYNAGYGNRVILNNGIKRGKSVVTTYNHLSRFAQGRGRVSRGEVIGYVGSTGYSTGCHLHFMVIANGRTTNPMAWL
ncbi:peptidoglycan DD-metalloendopeptidase family protein [Aeromicrobium sp.]|uniref:peptidoglycan DD-metalloendopeptidase family protein n=1 Tax=Aeromicrobium sp. TaxID=1871063 RepID=UPI003D6BD828